MCMYSDELQGWGLSDDQARQHRGCGGHAGIEYRQRHQTDLSLIAACSFANINRKTTSSSLLTGMMCRPEISAVSSSDTVVVDIGMTEDED